MSDKIYLSCSLPRSIFQKLVNYFIGTGRKSFSVVNELLVPEKKKRFLSNMQRQ